MIEKPINFYYSGDNGITWKELAKNESNSGIYEFDTAKLPDGPNYKIRITATDGLGAIGEAISGSFAVDNTGPSFVIDVSSGAPPPIKEGDKITLAITSSEDLKKAPEVRIIQKGAEPQSLTVSGSRKRFSASYTILRGFVGEANVSIKGEDLVGNVGTTVMAGGIFSVDRFGPPPPVIENISDNQIYGEPKIGVSGKAFSSKEVVLVLNGKEKFTVKPKEDGSFVFENIILSSANFGRNTLSFSGIDKDGVQGSDAIIRIKLNEPPRVSLVTKLEGTVSGRQKIEWTASDANNDDLSYALQYSVDGGKSWDNLVGGLIENYYDFETETLFDCSRCRLKVIADDGADKTEISSAEFAVRNNRSFSVYNIPDNYLINTTEPVFYGQASFQQNKIVSLKYSLDREKWLEAEADDGKFDSSLEKFRIKMPPPLVDGKYILTVRAEDEKGNFFWTFRMFIVDTVPPIPAVILFPGPQDIISKDKDIDAAAPGIQINVSGKAEAGAELELLMNNVKHRTVATSKGEFVFPGVAFLSRGLNRFSLLSYDAVGNISEIKGSLISNNSPEISILAPVREEFVGGKKKIEWEADDKDGDELTFQVFYRPKNGKQILLVQNFSGNVLEWDFAKAGNGEYELEIIANDGLSEDSDKIPFFIDNKPPRITFNIAGPIFTNNVKFIFSGKAKDDFSGIQYVEYSVDGANWYKALIAEERGNREVDFEFYHRPRLPEGTYKVKARATDGAGNVAYSEELETTIDTTPPFIGSALLSSGALIVFPDESGVINLLEGVSYKIAASASDDAREMNLSAGKAVFSFDFNKATVLWEGEFSVKDAGDYALEISAKDKFGNLRTKKIADLKILSPGFVFNEKNNEKIKGAEISLYFFDARANSWLLWSAASFGQKNPQETDEKGEYNFLAPAGKYFLEAKAKGFEIFKSKEIELNKTQPLNAKISLKEKKGIFEGLLRLLP